MTSVLVGRIVDIQNGKLMIEDHVTKEVIECESDSDEVLDLQIGEDAIFAGQRYADRFRVKRFEIRKFLDPLYEEDLLDASGRFTLVPPINNPFTDTFIQFMEMRREEEEKLEDGN
jgi:hypothetical protein